MKSKKIREQKRHQSRCNEKRSITMPITRLEFKRENSQETLIKDGYNLNVTCECCGHFTKAIETTQEDWEQFSTLLDYLKVKEWENLDFESTPQYKDSVWGFTMPTKWILSLEDSTGEYEISFCNNSKELHGEDCSNMLLNGIAILTKGQFAFKKSNYHF